MADQRHETSGQEPEEVARGNNPDSERNMDEETAQRLPGYTPQARTDKTADTEDAPSKDLPSFTPQGDY